MNEKTYILTQILEDDYGCEERPAGQAVTVLALLTDSEGNETCLLYTSPSPRDCD